MFKKIIISFICFLSLVALTASACTHSAKVGTATFCDDFRSEAQCYCAASTAVQPPSRCTDSNSMALIYKLMMVRFGSLSAACAYQHNTDNQIDTQVCINDWNSYHNAC